jgi:hypothetical protein
MTFTRIVFAESSLSPETSCARYYERFCERAKRELIIAEGIRSMIKLERNPQRPAAPRPKGAHGAGVDSTSGLIPGMRVSAAVVEAARRWATTPKDKRRLQPGLAERLAEEVGVSRGTLTRVGRRILRDNL